MVFKKLLSLAVERGAGLLGRQNDKTVCLQNDRVIWRQKYLIDASISRTNRLFRKIIDGLCQCELPVFTTRVFEPFFEEDTLVRCVVLTLKRSLSFSLENRINRARDFLSDFASSAGVSLVCQNKSFMIIGQRCRIVIIIEAYKIQANKICYFEDHILWTPLTNRMGVDQAFRDHLYMRAPGAIDSIWSRMGLNEFIIQYPNLADRLVANIKIQKIINKINMGLNYVPCAALKGNDLVISPIGPKTTKNENAVAGLGLSQECASFILPIIARFAPKVQEKNNSHCRPLARELWVKILEEMRRVSHLLYFDVYNAALDQYLGRFQISALDDGYLSGEYEPGDLQWYRCSRCFLLKHRKKLKAFYDFFISWMETQLKYSGCDSISIDPNLEFSFILSDNIAMNK